MSRPVAVLGAGGHAKVVIATLQAAGRTVRGCFDDAVGAHGTSILGVPVLGPAVWRRADLWWRQQLALAFNEGLR